MNQFAICFLGILISLPSALANEFLDKAKSHGASAFKDLEELYKTEGALVFKSDIENAKYMSALQNIEKNLEYIEEGKKPVLSPAAKIDKLLSQAKILQVLMAQYLVSLGGVGSQIRQGAIEGRIFDPNDAEARETFATVAKDHPFVGLANNGAVQFNTGEQPSIQFDALKESFARALLEAAKLGPGDTRLKTLADWGRDTVVLYRGDSQGKEILTGDQYRSMVSR